MTQPQSPALSDQTIELAKLLAALRNHFQACAESIDAYLNHLGKPLAMPATDKEYDKLPWESREGAKGPYQLVNENSSKDTELLQQLQAILTHNKGYYTEKGWIYYYWLGSTNENLIFRRKKKSVKPQATLNPHNSDSHARMNRSLTNLKTAGEKLTQHK